MNMSALTIQERVQKAALHRDPGYSLKLLFWWPSSVRGERGLIALIVLLVCWFHFLPPPLLPPITYTHFLGRPP